MDKTFSHRKKLIYILISAFLAMGIITYQIVKDALNKNTEMNALLTARVIVGQSIAIRNVYIREVVNKLRNDGTGAHTEFSKMSGYVPISAQFQRMLSEEATYVLKDIEYKPLSKWNIGPYSLPEDSFYTWGWKQLELQDTKVTNRPYNWKPVWRIDVTDKGKTLRYMDAVPATSNVCVACHQKYESSTAIQALRTTQKQKPHIYKEHHLIGAFTISIPLSSVQQMTNEYLNKFIMWILLILGISFILILWFSTQSLRQLRSMNVLTAQSNQDQLTGLLNRRGFIHALEQHLKLLNSDNQHFSMCTLDLDGFKNINDTYGHPAGDEVLKEIARVLQHTFREGDVLVRTGGDEFSVILPGCQLDNAKILCNKLLVNIRNINIEWKNSSLSIGASLGVSECKPGMDIDDIINETDEACYAAKKSGKNRINIR